MISSSPAPMSTTEALAPIEVPAWAWLVVAFAVFAIYMVTLENGALLGATANTLHEFFHNGRHFGAVPCH
ncbi:MAG: CbtB-domain containing protein [Acidimicrobiia bacterium]|nr:CbtB-domain containing protein [Acidimicrobiia bacterium]